MNELSRYLVAIRPTVLFGPPRVWEKLAAGMQAAVGMRSEEEQARFGEALVIGRQVQLLRAEGVEPTGELAEKWHSVDEQLFRPLRAMVGLDECKVVFGGAAPVPPDVIDFLRDVGLPMSEIWGMSEGTGGMTWDPVRNKSGKVGRAYPGLELKLADDGEVLCRGAIVFKGYLNDPERTREALDEEGWLHTGDIGELDDEGYLRIVDRKKELIITAGGKNVSPANIENTLKTVPLVGQVMAIGDAKPYLVALVTLDADACGVTYPGRSLAELASDTAVQVQVAAGIAAANQRLSRVEQVRRFVLLGEEWLPDSDLLTPTMKLKRRGVVARYAAEIDSLYAGGGVVVADRQEQLATSAS
jgi:long-chain acyl-CoA synthetase